MILSCITWHNSQLHSRSLSHYVVRLCYRGLQDFLISANCEMYRELSEGSLEWHENMCVEQQTRTVKVAENCKCLECSEHDTEQTGESSAGVCNVLFFAIFRACYFLKGLHGMVAKKAPQAQQRTMRKCFCAHILKLDEGRRASERADTECWVRKRRWWWSSNERSRVNTHTKSL